MRRMVTLLVLVVLMSVSMLAPAGAVPGGTVSDPIIDGLAGPLGLAVSPDGTVYVSQSFAGLLTSASPNGQSKVLASSTNPAASISGVVVEPNKSVVFTLAGQDNGDYIGLVQRVLKNGTVQTLGDPGTFEETNNPDRVNSYGFQGLSPECADQVPEEVGGGYSYRGVVDSNAYAIERMPDGSFVVADAGGNDIVRVGKDGRVRKVAVLPPLPETVTADVAAGFGLPECVVGATFNFDPVPTDVELGPDGMLYVSALPGGPEDDSLGARGRVFRINPASGALTEVASGFLGATDLAVAPDGTIYVAELFGNRISKVANGAPAEVVELNEPAALEWANGKLYATMNAFGNGAVVTIVP